MRLGEGERQLALRKRLRGHDLRHLLDPCRLALSGADESGAEAVRPLPDLALENDKVLPLCDRLWAGGTLIVRGNATIFTAGATERTGREGGCMWATSP